MSHLNELHIFSLQDYSKDGMRSIYEKHHLLPKLYRSVKTKEEQLKLKRWISQKFEFFWKTCSQLDLPIYRGLLLMTFADEDQDWFLSQCHFHGKLIELAELYEVITAHIYNPESPFYPILQTGALGSRLLNNLLKFSQKQGLTQPTLIRNQAEQLKLQSVFDAKIPDLTNLEDYETDSDERFKHRQLNWKQKSIHDIPRYNRVRKWEHVPKQPFSVPDSKNLLESFLPYLRLEGDNLKERFPLYHCVEIARIAFCYMVPDLARRFRFHFLSAADLLIMRIVGSEQEGADQFFDFVLKSGQLQLEESADLLKHLYPVLELNMGEALTQNIPFVRTHVYTHRSGRLHGHNVGIGIKRINEAMDTGVSYLSAGKMFLRMAEELFWRLSSVLEPKFIQDDIDIPSIKFEALLAEHPLKKILIDNPDQNLDKKFSVLMRWLKGLPPDEQITWLNELKNEVLRLQRMFFAPQYPNPFLLHGE
ncbi:MAG: hypothetical protein HQM12_17530 [SAR324 cluster bacterium]|nr:hypothetical protein [SAR324 cluster bacterium]